MKALDFFCGDSAEMVVALGFFDSIHVGHATIINKAQKIAKSHMVDCAVFTFANDIDCLFKNSSGLVLTYDERIEKLSKLSVNTVISTIFTKEFSSISAIICIFYMFFIVINHFYVQYSKPNTPF